ncbi:hypothetical protein [Azospirillum sp. B4]|uniref:hypothetical protein n=1 Tax=Azospirillum sp. B4 TaxID=95605 RepID=UPI0005C9E09E|nr:hypothetical protein [Azospirillum sp. B4]
MIAGEGDLRDKGIEWVLRLVAGALLPSLAPEPLIIGSMMLFHAVAGRIGRCAPPLRPCSRSRHR